MVTPQGTTRRLPLRTPTKQTSIASFFKPKAIEVVIYQDKTPPSSRNSRANTPADDSDDPDPIIYNTSKRRKRPSTSRSTSPMVVTRGKVQKPKKSEPKRKTDTIYISDDDEEEESAPQEEEDSASEFDDGAPSVESSESEEPSVVNSSEDESEEGIVSDMSEDENPHPAKRRKPSPAEEASSPKPTKKLSKKDEKILNILHAQRPNLGADENLYGELGDPMDLDDEADTEEVEAPVKKKKAPAKKKPANPDAPADPYTYKIGLDESLKPISRLDDIFADMTSRALEPVTLSHQLNLKYKKDLGLDELVPASDDNTLYDLIKHLNGRKLRLATMCSGTESPILALDLVAKSLRARGLNFEMEHMFSAEIVPYKQAYIERNFNPPIIFRDIKELSIPGATEATTAYGGKAKIPGNIDVLITGFSCVDFSGLNSKTLLLEQAGESGDTFFAMRDYAQKYRPKIIVLENVAGAPWPKIGNYMAAVGYACKHMQVDTKNYYIPHTRCRGYMMCIDMYDEIQKDKRSPREKKLVLDLKFSEYIEQKFLQPAGLHTYVRRMKHFERQASSSVEDFLLEVDDPRVVAGRTELSNTKRGQDEKNKRVVDWTRCQGRHEDYRSRLGLGNRRYLTNWENGGTMTPRDYWWPDWWKNQVERIWDHVEMSYLRALTRGIDLEYKFRIIDFSQNIDRSTDTGGFGLTGCITPTGIPYSTMRGGPLIGLEALALQGIPIDILQLTRESQKELKDLAGNAMSSTVVGAATLAALIARFNKLERGTGVTPAKFAEVTPTIEGKDSVKFLADFSPKSMMTKEKALELAAQTYRQCYCEDRFSLATAPLQKCVACGHTTCTDCGTSPKHEYVAWSPKRVPPSVFEAQIKAALPMKIVFDNITLDDVHNARERAVRPFNNKDKKLHEKLDPAIEVALQSELRFHSVKRTDIWTATFESTFARLNLVFFGDKAEWRLFVRPDGELAVNDPVRLAFEQNPIARMAVKSDGKKLTDGQWELFVHYAEPLKTKATVTGKGTPIPSYFNVVGLIIGYNEYTFPELEVEFEDPEDAKILSMDISGTYQAHQNCGMSMGSLHVKKSTAPRLDAGSDMYFYMDPHRTHDIKRDPFVFTQDKRRLGNHEVRPIVARVHTPEGSSVEAWKPQVFQLKPNLEPGQAVVMDKKISIVKSKAKVEEKVKYNEKIVSFDSLMKPQTITLEVDGVWHKTNLKFSSGQTTTSGEFVRVPEDFDISPAKTCTNSHVILRCEATLPKNETSRYQKKRWLEVGHLEYKEFFSEFAWLLEKVRQIPGLDKWRKFKGELDCHCEICAPSPPVMKWKLDEKNTIVPFEDPQTAAPFEKQMKDRPAPILTQVLGTDEKIAIKLAINPQTLVHRAAAKISESGHSSLEWRLVTDNSEPAKYEFDSFKLPNNNEDPEADKPPKFKLSLRPEQSRSLHWMIAQEQDKVKPFIEEEVEEATIPLIGWRAEGRARRAKVIRGGVLADQVGYGKTVTTLGLITSMQEADQKNSKVDERGVIPVKGSLILVPKQLPGQWEAECRKFLPFNMRYIVIKDAKSLASIRIKDIMEADIIIASIDLMSNDTYLFKLAQFAGVIELPEKTSLRAQSAWYKNAMEKIKDNVEVLKNDPETLGATIASTLAAEGEVAMEAETYVPSKRLRGKAYQAYKAKIIAAKKNAMSDLFGEDGQAVAENATVEKISTKDDGKKFVSTKRADIFGLKSLRDKQQLKNPIFELFRFSRVVVDEYVYVADSDQLTIANLNSRAKWILSGTPPLQDFLDVKKMSKFLGIDLGIDDFTTGVMNEKNISELTKNLTKGEQFRTFKQKQSYAWHNNRHQLAQRFLNQFVRQNIADIEAIDGATHFVPINLPGSERAMYIELQQLLAASEFKMVKGQRGLENHRMARIRKLLGESQDPKEALMKCATFFDADKPAHGAKSDDPTANIIAIRLKQRDELKEDIRKCFKQAEYLALDCSEPCEQYDSLIKQILSNYFGDTNTTDILTKWYNKSHANRSLDHWSDFYMTEEQQKEWDEANPKKAKAKAAKKGKGKATKKRKRDEDEDEDLSDFIDDTVGDDAEDAATANSKKPLLPQGKKGNVEFANFALRDVTNTLRKSVVEYVARERCLRFFYMVQELQKQGRVLKGKDGQVKIEQKTKGVKVEGIECSKCNGVADPDFLFVLSGCGHATCKDCFEEHVEQYYNNPPMRELCHITGCNAIVKDYQVVPATEFMVEDIDRSTLKEYYGRKIVDIVDVIKKIPADEQVLLFGQFPDVLKRICDAFNNEGITFHSIYNSQNPSDVLNKFQNDTGKQARKVLIMNIGDSSAAGSNITNANHVIFVSPYLADREALYHGAMTQAIGRARRYGQTRVVHTYHFLSIRTTDIDVFEAMNHCIVDEAKDSNAKEIQRQRFEPYEGWYEERGVVGTMEQRDERGKLRCSVWASTVADKELEGFAREPRDE